MSQRLADESGLAGIVLVIAIGWALTSVVMLTSTLVSARQIDDRVAVITTEVGDVDADLDSVELAVETDRIAKDILAAAEPLSGQLDQVVASAQSIDNSVTSILSTAQDINGNAKTINATVRSINTTAGSILGNANSIMTVVDSITCGGMGRDGIELWEDQVKRCGVRGVPGINTRVQVVVDWVSQIKGDTGNVLTVVKDIRTHANSIDCSPAMRPNSTACEAQR